MATTTLMSFADFERLDAGADHVELLKGELIRVPPPYADHMEIGRRLFRQLDSFVERLRSEGGRVGPAYFEMGYRFHDDPPTWLRPDVSLTFPDQARERFYLGGPLIAFEVVSESDTARQ